MLTRLFEENVAGRLNSTNYATMFARYQTEQEQLTDRVCALAKQLVGLDEVRDNSRKWVDLIALYKDLQALDAVIVNELIEKILIHESEKVDGKRTQKIEINYRFIGRVPEEN